jgi:hypothetical protein
VAEAFRFTAGAAGSAQVASIYVVRASHSSRIELGLYTDKHGHPGRLLASGSKSALAASQWNKLTLGSATIARRSNYWLAVLDERGSAELSGNDLGRPGYVERSRSSALPKLPMTWNTGARSSTRSLSAYVSGTAEYAVAQRTSAPVNTALPTISGQDVVGQTLTASVGSWMHSPTSYAYQWQDCNSQGGVCFNISGATQSTYVLTSGDVNDAIRVVVTAANSYGKGSATSASTPPVTASGGTAPVLLVGNATVASLADNDSAGLAEAFRFTASAAGSAQDAWIYVDSGSTATGVNLGLYADNGGQPGSLLASGITSAPSAGSWNEITLKSAPSLTSGTTYWIGVLGTGGQLNFRDVDPGSGNCSQNSSQTTLTSMSSTWNPGTAWTTCSISAYVAGTSGGGNAPASPPSAPANTALPTITGQTVQGSTLAATNGTWNGSPTSYSYQWQDCNSSGASCLNISGATSSTYTLAASDVSSTIRVSVTAKNTGGSTPATSAVTAVVTAPSGGGGTQTLNCYPSPGACGYPDPNYSWTGAQNAWSSGGGGVGPTAGNVSVPCSSLPTVNGNVTLSTNGQTYQNENVIGQLDITASNVIVNNVCVTYGINGGSSQVMHATGANALIENSTIGGTTDGGSNGANTIEQAVSVDGGSGPTTLLHDYLHNCGECVHGYPVTVNDSYITANGDQGTSDHYEDFYQSGGGTLSINHDTLLVKSDQTANVFQDTNSGSGGTCSSHLTLTNSLLSGAGYSVYACSAASSVGSSTMTVTGNHFARCTTTPLSVTGGGNWLCSGGGYNGADSHGLYPYSGSYGLDSYTYCTGSGQNWSGNTWDDNGTAASC